MVKKYNPNMFEDLRDKKGITPDNVERVIGEMLRCTKDVGLDWCSCDISAPNAVGVGAYIMWYVGHGQLEAVKKWFEKFDINFSYRYDETYHQPYLVFPYTKDKLIDLCKIAAKKTIEAETITEEEDSARCIM